MTYDGLENVLSIAAVNGGTHAAPTVAGDTLYARTEVLEPVKLPGRSDLGALRLRTFGLRDLPPAQPLDLKAAASPAAPERRHLVLELDYVVTMPRRPSAR